MEVRKMKMGSVLVMLGILVLVSVGQAVPITYMDATTHNGAFADGPAGYTNGFWSNPLSVPTEWEAGGTQWYNIYSSDDVRSTTAARWIQVGTYSLAINNTGEVVPAYHAFTISAYLGGSEGVTAKARVYATENADGSGMRILLADVYRVNVAGQGYALFSTTGTPGYAVPPTLAGYYVQVVAANSTWIDSIVVTSELSSEPPRYLYMDDILRNGAMNPVVQSGPWSEPDSKPYGGWDSTYDPNTYTSGGDFYSVHTFFDSRIEAVFNNTGETVPANHRFTIQAALTGDTGATSQASVYATENADGSGAKVLLAQVSRPGDDAVVDQRFTKSSTPSSPTSSSVAGYYVQVHLKTIGEPNNYGHYDSIIVSSQETIPNVYMDATLHNGSLTASHYTIHHDTWTPVSGTWAAEPDAIPWGGWSVTMDPNFVYTATALANFILESDSPAGEVINNTGEAVPANQQFTVQADLGGKTGATAGVSVYATENADGTGTTVLLAQISRAGDDADGDSLFTVSATGSETAPSLAGYYVQVVLETTGATSLDAYYDNIVVTSGAPGCRDQFGAAIQTYYDRYVTEPVAWCWQYQCHGDADNAEEEVFLEGFYRVYNEDLTLLINNWQGTPEGGANPAADFDHAEEEVFLEGFYAIYNEDLTLLINNWAATSGSLSDCPSYLP